VYRHGVKSRTWTCWSSWDEWTFLHHWRTLGPWTGLHCPTSHSTPTRWRKTVVTVAQKVKFSHTRYWAFGPELIPVYRQSACDVRLPSIVCATRRSPTDWGSCGLLLLCSKSQSVIRQSPIEIRRNISCSRACRWLTVIIIYSHLKCLPSYLLFIPPRMYSPRMWTLQSGGSQAHMWLFKSSPGSRLSLVSKLMNN